MYFDFDLTWGDEMQTTGFFHSHLHEGGVVCMALMLCLKIYGVAVMDRSSQQVGIFSF